jgi:hypothetical protein
MSMSHSPFHDDLDRLVDGTLDEASRRRLMARMEAEPEAWRLCALAFLEAQAWGEALRPLARDAADPLAVRASRPAPPHSLPLAGRAEEGGRESQTRRSPSLLRPLALAASVALAFALGHSLRRGTDRPASDMTVAAQPAPAQPAPAANPAHPRPAPVERGPTSEIAAPLIASAEPPDDAALDKPDDDPVAAIPADLRRRLASEGFRVEPRGGYRPIRTADGRTIRVPYQDVRVRFVGNRTY